MIRPTKHTSMLYFDNVVLEWTTLNKICSITCSISCTTMSLSSIVLSNGVLRFEKEKGDGFNSWGVDEHN